MKTEPGLLNGLFNSSAGYYSAQTKYLRSKALLRSADAATEFSSIGTLVLLAAFMLLFLSIGLGFWLGEIFLSYKWGFLTVGIFYLACFVLFLFLRKKLFGQAYRTRVLHVLTGGDSDYHSLQENARVYKQEARQSEEALRKNVSELKTLINQLQGQINGLTQDTPPGQEQAKGPVNRELVSNVVNLLLNTFVLRNAGLVKRTIVPIIANSIISNSFKAERGGGGFFANLKRRFFKSA